ncbi:carbohydrate-binding module family 1 protein [Xylariaceae sp. FL0255]|nr:carbohydrate-binding module family 1 protein [Xylariaceae sp. FL0255]
MYFCLTKSYDKVVDNFMYLLILFQLATLVASQTLTIDVKTKYQVINGFGFSQAFGRASQFQDAASATQKQALDYLFNTTTGAGFSIIRNRIGSNGTGDSIEPTNPGSPSATPTYVWDDDDEGQVWFSQQAMSYGVKTIYADAWSAPGFMKTSGSDQLPGYLCGSTGHACATGDWQQAYANFLVKYVQEYASAGITITHLGFLNEPDYTTSYSQMQISSNAQEAISFIPILYDTVQSAGLSSLQITCCDATGWNTQSTYTTALVNANVTQYLNVITSHSYSSDATTPLSQTSLRKWNTEGGPSTAFETTWYSNGGTSEGFTWASKLATAMVDAELSAYLFWEGFEIEETQSGSHLVDAENGVEATASGILWAFAMWSRYIRPGAYRVSTTGTISNTIVGAFENTDGSVIVVLTNSGSTTESAELSFATGFTPATASAWVTSQTAGNFATTIATLSSGTVTVSVPAMGVVTVKLISSGSTTSSTTKSATTTTTTTTTTLKTSTATSSVTTSTTSTSCSALYGQCGGLEYIGTTCCSSGTCTYSNDYYSQCL